MDWLVVASLAVAFISAIGTVVYNYRESKATVRSQAFAELAEAVKVLGAELDRTRDDLRETRDEHEQELKAAARRLVELTKTVQKLMLNLEQAERQIITLETANLQLRQRVFELEQENKALKDRPS